MLFSIMPFPSIMPFSSSTSWGKYSSHRPKLNQTRPPHNYSPLTSQNSYVWNGHSTEQAIL